MRCRLPLAVALLTLLFSGLAQAADPGLQVLSVTTEKDGGQTYSVGLQVLRSEERRVGKECRSRWSPYH